MFRAISDAFGFLFGFLSDIGTWLLDGIMTIFQPILDIIGAIFYLLYYLGLVLVKVLHLVFNVCKLLIGLIAGIFQTITGLSYTGTSNTIIPGKYTEAFSQIGNTMTMLQLDKVAYILIFGLWIFTAFAAIRIIGSMRGGGE